MRVGVATKAVIFNKNTGRVLVIGKSEHDEINPKTLDLPGGRLEFGEAPQDGLKREVSEETAINDIEILGVSNVWSIVKGELHLVGITYAVRSLTEEITLSFEHEKSEWLDVPSLLEDNDVPNWIKEEVKLAVKVGV